MINRWETTTQKLDKMRGLQDTAVWDAFSKHFFPVICHMARHKGLAHCDAEDAAQQTLLSFVQAVRQGKYDRSKGKLSAFLFGVAQRTILDTGRRQARHASAPATLRASQIEEHDTHLTWETQWQKIILLQSLEQVKETTDPKVFEAFDLYCLQDRPAREVAETLHITPNAVYIAKTRVLSRLRAMQQRLEDWEG